jgi:hypothetical protein
LLYCAAFPYIKVKDAVGNASDALIIDIANYMPFAGGDGSSGNPYQVSNTAQLNAVRDYLGSYFIQTANITVDTATYPDWSPIGTAAAAFTGNYDGDGHRIGGLKINTTASSSADTVLGLFGVVGNGAQISDVTLENVDIDVATGSGTSFTSFIGSLAGVNYGTITNCSVTGNIDAASTNIKIGGLVGCNGNGDGTDDGDITGCSANCALNVTVNYQQGHVGGLVGSSFSAGSTITNCTGSGTVTGTGGSTVNSTGVYAGGLIGYASNTDVINCGSNAAVSATNVRTQAHAGGLIGGIVSGCSISNCYSTGNATAGDSSGSTGTKVSAGGFIAYSFSSSSITNCFSTGTATATGTGASTSSGTYAYVYAGGFLGFVSSGSSADNITRCYATGATSAQVNTYGYAFAGGFGGYYTWAHISKSYGTGDAQATSAAGYASAGGFTGYLFGANASSSPSTLTNCYGTGDAAADCVTAERAGGLSGVVQSSTVSYCYSAGIPTVAHATSILKCGGLVGASTAGTIGNSYYDSTVSGKTDTDRGTPETTADMKNAAFVTLLTNAGATWKLVSNLNGGYPVLDGVGIGARPTCLVSYRNGEDTSTVYGTDTVAQGYVFAVPSSISPTNGGKTLSGWYTESAHLWNFSVDTTSAATLLLNATWGSAAPTVTTADVTAFTATTATMGGEVTATGGETVTDRGVVYSSVETMPTIGAANVTQDANGTGTGVFSESVGSLTPHTRYYVRAYATNSVNTAYGSAVSFTTGAAQLGAPSGAAWSGSSATWGGVTNASGYRVQLRKDDADQGTAMSVGAGVPSYNFGLNLWKSGSGAYTFTVTAVGDGTVYTDSAAGLSDSFNYTKPAGISVAMTASIWQGVASVQASNSSSGGFFQTDVVKPTGLEAVKIMLGSGVGGEEVTEGSHTTYLTPERDWYLADIPADIAPGAYVFAWVQIAQDNPATVYQTSITLTVNSAITLSPGTCDFGSLEVGYASAPAEQTVTVTNNGAVSITLTRPFATSYTVGALSATNLAVGSTATFTLQPKLSLGVGSYNETVFVYGSNGASAQAAAKFTVNPLIFYAIGVNPTRTDFGSLAVGYLQPAAQTVTVTNTGNQALTLYQPAAVRYEIGALSATELIPGASATFTVRPKAGLPVGVADETIPVYASNSANAQLDAAFTCTAGTTYTILNGNGATFQHGAPGGSGLTITSSGDFSLFTGLTLNGTFVPPSNYDASSGSTVVTLHHAYLNALSAGTYDLVFHYTNGSATARIVVQDPEAVTGDNDDLVIYGVLTVLAAAALFLALTGKKKVRR